MTIEIRDECPGDEAAVAALIAEAFRGHPHSVGTEPAIVDALRRAGALCLSLVAVETCGEVDGPEKAEGFGKVDGIGKVEGRGKIVGHIALSEVTMADGAIWIGLGPLAVLPALQGRGIGSSLVRAALERLDATARGYVLVGDAAYYARFGFAPGRASHAGVAERYVLTRAHRGPVPRGPVTFHAAFSVPA